MGDTHSLWILVDSYIYLPEEEKQHVYQECFKGMELKSCQHCGTKMLRNDDGSFNGVPEDSVLGSATNDPELIQQPFTNSVYDQADFEPPSDTGDIDYRRNQQPYCLHCCSMTNPEPGYNVAETWDLYCPIDGLDRPGGLLPFTDFDNYQFRFARRDGLSDIEVVTCDLLRTPEQANLILQGYELDLWVVDYYEGVNYWRGVSRCEARFIFEPVWDQDSCLETFNPEYSSSRGCLPRRCVPVRVPRKNHYAEGRVKLDDKLCAHHAGFWTCILRVLLRSRGVLYGSMWKLVRCNRRSRLAFV